MVRCDVCAASSVETIRQAIPLFADVVRWTKNQGIVAGIELGVELCGRDRLVQLLHRPDHGILGATLHTTYFNNARPIRNEIKGVGILKGLPKALFQGVAAHELGHVWLAVHDVLAIPDWAQEGFCNLLSFRLHQQLGTQEDRFQMRSLERNPDPVYGEGFRRVRDMANRIGFENLIRSLRSHYTLPGFNG